MQVEELVLVRHGESVGNVADADARRRGAGRLDLDTRDPDTPLSERGEQQARVLARARRAQRGAAAGRRAHLPVRAGRHDGARRRRRRPSWTRCSTSGCVSATSGILDGLTGVGHPGDPPGGGGAPCAAGQVLLPPAGRRELDGRRAARASCRPRPRPALRGPARLGVHPPGRDHELPPRARGAGRAGPARRRPERAARQLLADPVPPTRAAGRSSW